MAAEEKKIDPKNDKEIVEQAHERFKRCVEAEREDRENFVDDTKFYKGDQWPNNLKKIREQGSRPCLTVNRMPQFVRQVTNDQRQNRPSIKVRPADNYADPETAQVFSGLVRHIESNSNADQAYDNAFFYAVAGGFGYFRVLTEYLSAKSFDQEIFIKRIADSLTVYRDPDSREPDGSDFRFCFIIDDMPRDDYIRQYGKADCEEWDQAGFGNTNDWVSGETIRVAEYYYITYEDKKLYLLEDRSVVHELPEGATAVSTRDVKVPQVKWVKICGDKIKEKRDLPGRFIPVIPVYGDEIIIEGKRELISLIRFAKDPQRMFNYWRSTETELLGLQAKAPFVVAEGQLEGYENQWKNANTDAVPYLTYKPVALNGQPVGPPQRQGFASPPTGVIQGALNAEGDMKSVTGIYDSSLGANGNETSGKAILARQKEGDTSTFHYIDNLTRSIRQCGRVLVDYIPVIYDTPRIARILGVDGKEEMVPLNQPFAAKEKGRDIQRVHQMDVGTYDVVCAAGPSYSTQRQESAEAMSQIIPTNPQLMAVAGDLFVEAMDWPGADAIAKRIKKSMDPKLTAEDDEEQPEIPVQLQQQMAMMDDAIQKREDAIVQLQQTIKQAGAEKAELEAKANSKQTDYALKTQDNELKLELDRLTAAIRSRELEIKDKELTIKAAEIEVRRYELAKEQLSENDTNSDDTSGQSEISDGSQETLRMLAEMTAQIAQGNQIIAQSLNRPNSRTVTAIRDANTNRLIGAQIDE